MNINSQKMKNEQLEICWKKYEGQTLTPEEAFRAGFESGWEESKVYADPSLRYQGTVNLIYDAYPRKVGKHSALKAIQKALHTTNRAILMDATIAFAKAVATWPAEDRKFIPHPATWFNRGSYLDDPKEWVRQSLPKAPCQRIPERSIRFAE